MVRVGLEDEDEGADASTDMLFEVCAKTGGRFGKWVSTGWVTVDCSTWESPGVYDSVALPRFLACRLARREPVGEGCVEDVGDGKAAARLARTVPTPEDGGNDDDGTGVVGLAGSEKGCDGRDGPEGGGL